MCVCAVSMYIHDLSRNVCVHICARVQCLCAGISLLSHAYGGQGQLFEFNLPPPLSPTWLGSWGLKLSLQAYIASALPTEPQNCPNCTAQWHWLHSHHRTTISTTTSINAFIFLIWNYILHNHQGSPLQPTPRNHHSTSCPRELDYIVHVNGQLVLVLL